MLSGDIFLRGCMLIVRNQVVFTESVNKNFWRYLFLHLSKEIFLNKIQKCVAIHMKAS